MSPPVPLSTRRNAASPPKPLSTPPPYCASPPLVPVESRGPPPCGSGSEEEDKAPSAAPDEYLSLATPAQRSYFVTLSGLFEGAALGKGPGRDGDEDEEGALAEKGGRRRRGASGEEAGASRPWSGPRAECTDRRGDALQSDNDKAASPAAASSRSRPPLYLLSPQTCSRVSRAKRVV